MSANVSQVHREEALLWLSIVGLIVTLALASLMAPLAVEAQQASKVRRIGLLTPGAPPPSGASLPFEQAFASWAGWRDTTSRLSPGMRLAGLTSCLTSRLS